jgi:hypothetical protein
LTEFGGGFNQLLAPAPRNPMTDADADAIAEVFMGFDVTL